MVSKVMYVMLVLYLCPPRPPALHLAMHLGHLGCVKILLEESNINMGSLNMK